MKKLSRRILAVIIGTMAISAHAGLWDGLKKIGSGVAEVAGGVVDATVNVTTSVVQSVSSSSTVSIENGTQGEVPVRAAAVQSTTLSASDGTPSVSTNTISIGEKKKETPSRVERMMNRRQDAMHDKHIASGGTADMTYAQEKVDLRNRLEQIRFRDDFNAIESVSERNRILDQLNGMKSEVLALPDEDRSGEGKRRLGKLLFDEKEIIASITELNKRAALKREAREKAAAEERELAAKQQAEREAREKAKREAREKAAAEERELAAKRQAEREAKEKAEREAREKAAAEGRELAAKRQAEREAREKDEREAREKAAAATDQASSGKSKVLPGTGSAVAGDASLGVAANSGSAEVLSSSEEDENWHPPVKWKRLLITFGIWLAVVAMGCLVSYFSKKPTADILPKKVRVCYFISKWDYAPAMLSAPLFLVLLIGFGGTNIGRVWTNILLLVCYTAVLAMNWWALFKANTTWVQALCLLPMRLVVGTLGLFLPVASALLGLVSIGLAIQGSNTIRDTNAKISRQYGRATRKDEENLKQGRTDIAASGVAGALGAAGGWASKKMWSSIHSRTRSLVDWDADI